MTTQRRVLAALLTIAFLGTPTLLFAQADTATAPVADIDEALLSAAPGERLSDFS